jgi:hypothetical protein
MFEISAKNFEELISILCLSASDCAIFQFDESNEFEEYVFSASR